MSKLYLDDIRKPPDESWAVVRSYREFVEWLEANGLPDVISFDHDLGHGQAYTKPRGKRLWIPREEFMAIPTGLDCAKWMLRRYGLPKTCVVHSMNPAGAQMIKDLLNDYSKQAQPSTDAALASPTGSKEGSNA